MKVAVLQQFLRSLVPALEAAGDRKVSADLAEASNALDSFEALDIADFSAFLSRAQDYHTRGAVAVPGPGEPQAEGVLKLVVKLYEAMSGSSGNVKTTQEELAGELQKLMEQAGLKGKLTLDPKWAEAQAAKSRIAPHVKAIYELAARIVAPDIYNDPSIREHISRLETELTGETLKAVASEFSIKATAKAKPGKVIMEILTKLCGHQPQKAKGKTATIDPAVVDEYARRLAELIERSIDPDAVNEAEVEEELARLKELPKPTLVEVIARAGVDGVRPAAAVSAILQRVRNRLTAARRARERAEV